MKPTSILSLEKKLGLEINQTNAISMSDYYYKKSAEYVLNRKGKIIGLKLIFCELVDISFLKDYPILTELNLSNNNIKEMSPLKTLVNLNYVSLQYNSIQKAFIVPQWKYLDLSHNKINYVSSEEKFEGMHYLNLQDNEITEFKFNDFQVQILNLSNNKIETVELKNSNYLQQLNLFGNPIRNIFFENLSGIERLDLGNYQLKNIHLKNLTRLSFLNLRNNRISDISSLYNLPELIDLNIDSNPISDYGSLQNFPLLEVLKVKDNITFESLANLTYLREIYFSGKSDKTEILQQLTNTAKFPSLITIGYKPTVITNLENDLKCELTPTFPGGIDDWVENQSYVINNMGDMMAFRLRRKELEDISFLNQFRKLEILDLRINNINDISVIQGLSQLRELHLYGNVISELPPDFFESLPSLEYINLSKNPIKNVPLEMFDKDENVLEAVKTYLMSVKGKREYLHQAKMILIGNGEVGKSSIRIKLLDKKASLPKKEERTQGLDIGIYKINDLPTAITKLGKNINFDLTIWDFGGQGRYREVQQLFCGRKALYLFVTSIDDCPDSEDYVGFEYWLSMAKAYGYDQKEDWQSPIIHIVNKCDLGKKMINQTALFSVFDNIHEFVKISCETLQNFDELEENIRTALPKISKDIFTNQFSEKWFAVKQDLNKKRNQNHITLQEYDNICSENGLNKAEGDLWLDYLDRIGDLIYFRDNPMLNNFIVLNPLWVKDCIYKVLDSRLIQNGVLQKNFLSFIWNEYKDSEQESLVNIMLAYKFCYSQKDNQGNIFYIIPALLPEQKPIIPDHLSNYDYDLRFDYSPFIPAGTLNKLMVELNKNIYQSLNWKNGCVLHLTENNRVSFAELTEEWEAKTVFVRIKGDNPHNLYNLIRKTLLQLLDDLKKIKFLDSLEMSIKIMVDGEYELPKTILKFGRQQDFRFLFGKETAFDKKLIDTPLRSFVSYSKFDGESSMDGVNYLEEFKQTLAPLSSRFNNLLETWDDTYLIAGDDWNDKIVTQLNSCDAIFLLLSPHFLNTRYIVDVELNSAIERHKKKECIVVPIIIKPCGWTDISQLKIFNGIPRKNNNISAWRNNPKWTSRYDAWHHVYEEVKKVIEDFRNKK